MPAIYGGVPSRLARDTQRDPDRYGPGVTKDFVQTLFDNDPIISQLCRFSKVAEAVGEKAFEASQTAGVTVVDPLDGQAFTWNQPERQKVPVSSGAFKLFAYAPVVAPAATLLTAASSSAASRQG